MKMWDYRDVTAAGFLQTAHALTTTMRNVVTEINAVLTKYGLNGDPLRLLCTTNCRISTKRMENNTTGPETELEFTGILQECTKRHNFSLKSYKFSVLPYWGRAISSIPDLTQPNPTQSNPPL